MSKLIDHFDRIAIISLPHRVDRRERLVTNLTKTNLATPEDLTWIEAVDGRKEEIPSWWKAGHGAWGCRASQLQTIEAAQRDSLENILIIEDDAVFHPHASEWLNDTAGLLPKNWDFFFLGGEHLVPPNPAVHAYLVKGTYITRTHAYAVNHRAFASVIDRVRDPKDYQEHPGWHIDHQFGYGQLHGIWNSYAPAWWLAGQEEGESNISIQKNPRRWWPEGNNYWKLPFVHLPDPELGREWLFHPIGEAPSNTMEIAVWLRNIAREAWLQCRLPSCSLNPKKISSLWPGGCRILQTENEIAQLADYPANGLFQHSFSRQ